MSESKDVPRIFTPIPATASSTAGCGRTIYQAIHPNIRPYIHISGHISSAHIREDIIEGRHILYPFMSKSKDMSTVYTPISEFGRILYSHTSEKEDVSSITEN